MVAFCIDTPRTYKCFQWLFILANVSCSFYLILVIFLWWYLIIIFIFIYVLPNISGAIFHMLICYSYISFLVKCSCFQPIFFNLFFHYWVWIFWKNLPDICIPVVFFPYLCLDCFLMDIFWLINDFNFAEVWSIFFSFW